MWKNFWASFLSAIIGGVLIDLDHFIDYFLVFGKNFRLDYFNNGYQFLKSGNLYIFFHAWEYAIILMLLVFTIKSKALKSVFLGLALGLLLHIGTDVVVDRIPPKTYLIINRIDKNFKLKELISPEHYAKDLIKRAMINWNNL